MSYTKAIRKGYVCRFHTGCSGCAMKNLCVSASSLHSSPREYLLRNRGYRVPKNEAMERGILKHELYQQGMRDAKLIPFHVLRKEMYSGREITIKECHVCVHPTTQIQTPYKLKTIKYIKNEDVIDYMGNPNKAKLNQKKYNGKLYKIKILGNYTSLKCTPDHKLYVISTQSCKQRFKDRRFKICWETCSGLNYSCNGKDVPFTNYKKEWKKAQNIKINDLIIIPKLKLHKEIRHIDLFDKMSIEYKRIKDYTVFTKKSDSKITLKRNRVGQFIKNQFSETSVAKKLGYKNTVHFRKIKSGEKKIKYMDMPFRIKVDKDLMRFMGLFIAEGSTNRYTTDLSFSKEENHLVDEIKGLVKKIFQCNNKIIVKKRNNGLQVRTQNKVLTKFLKKWCYCSDETYNASTKSFPLFYLNCNKDLLKHLIKAYWEGDGTYGNSTYSFTTVSKNLAYQLRQILSLWGIYPSINKNEKPNNIILGRKVNVKTQFRISISGQQAKIFEENILNMKKINNKFSYQKFYQDVDYFYIPIKEIKLEDYQGPVYDLTVENGHSYIANGLTVHNCSPFYGLRGVVDILKFQYDKEKKVMNIYAEEIKSSFWMPYIMQMAVYGLILSDLNFQVIQEVTKRKTRRVPFTFYPKDRFSLNLKVNLQIFAKKPYTIEWMKNNVMTKWADGVSCSVLQKAKKLRKYHKLGINWLSELPVCEHCNHEMCGYYSRFCSKLSEFNPDSPTHQMYWGKNVDTHMLIKTKPSLNLAELETMVKIK